ncbi:MFS transporter [Demequina capsici]|uniref:MFS transporter n=1 Tax=Demequina capsici TaxID=3075620 RepID=A0AA96JCP8_9MICO|nr:MULTISPECIES: MFS transporter [unclassified Demequina]WNM24329.1 MFS transporter [Demequina sp. OYTSA14]WNM27151.1 MFS transporter [Demequina sp. PMTSA13]
MNRTFSSLGIRNYRLWFAGAVVSNIGTWMQRIAQDWVVLTVLTDNSGFAVGVTTALQFLPFLLIGPWTGVLADRVDHRKLLLVTQVVGAALSVGLGAIVLSGHAQLWHVYAFALGLGFMTAFDNPARQAFVSDLVPASHLSNAVGLNSASFNAARLIGPGLAGLLIAWIGSGWVFLLNGFTFLATIIALLLMRSDEFERQRRAPRGPGQVLEGVRYVRSRPDIIAILVVVGVVGMLGLNFQLTSAMMARVEFGRGPGEYGVLGSILAIGSLGGALLAARRRQPTLKLVVIAAFGFGAANSLLALMPTFWTFAIAGIPVGFAALTMITAANATVQTTTEPSMRGRVLALYMMVFMGTTPIGSPIVGWVGEQYGPRWAIGIGAIASLIVATAVGLWSARRWNVVLELQVRRPFVRFGRGLAPEAEPIADIETTQT